MNNNILFNLMTNLTNGTFQNGSNLNMQSNQVQNSPNTSEYPDVFFSNSKNVATVQQTQPFNNNENNASNNNNLMNNNLFNNNSLFQLLPLLLNGKGSNANIGKMLENINPNFSQIMSLFTNGSKNKKNDSEKVESNIIDITNFKEIK